eukprot:gene39300-48558_t
MANNYIGDTDNFFIRKLTVSTGLLTNIVGTSNGLSGDNGPATKTYGDGGPATSARMRTPSAIWTDSENNFAFITDSGCNNIRRVSLKEGTTIYTYSGITSSCGPSTGSSGDGGTVTAA